MQRRGEKRGGGKTSTVNYFVVRKERKIQSIGNITAKPEKEKRKREKRGETNDLLLVPQRKAKESRFFKNLQRRGRGKKKGGPQNQMAVFAKGGGNDGFPA